MNNTPPYLVARALRARRTVIWSYATGFTLNNRFCGLTRSQILKDVRHSYRLLPTEYTYNVEYDVALDSSTLPNPAAHGISVYAHPTPSFVPTPLTPEQRNANLQRLYVDRIEAACFALGDLNPILAAKIRSVLAWPPKKY
jgi:hypothetical protein